MRHRRMVAPINSIKHYVHRINNTIANGAIAVQNVVNAVAETRVNAEDVLQGSIIKAVYIEEWLHSNLIDGASNQVIFIIEKIPSGGVNMTAAQALNLGAYPNKKNILFASQGNLGDNTTNTVPFHRGWILMPKGKQRFGIGDRLVIDVAPVGGTVDQCGVHTYKEYM